ncbi:MAG TPA: rod shape-determining protein, partial [Pyrinomonadaceae bacterium]|nr:rod shape-determining protein [Pyrinomonadaceae bacterium]
ITGAAMPVASRLARVVQRALGDLQPEVLSDIYDRGVILTGGGALFEGMPELITRETKLPTRVAADPRHACVRGLQQLYDEPLLLRRVARNEHSALLEAAGEGAFEV